MFKKRYSHEIPKWISLFGVNKTDKNYIGANWGYILFGNGPELYLNYTYEHGIPEINIGFLIGIHIEIPFLKQRYEDINNSPEYGIKYHDKGLWFHYGLKNKVFWMPWCWEHVCHKVWSKDGWINSIEEYDHKFGKSYKDKRISEIYKYEYKLKNGDLQVTNAEIYKEKREWRWRWLKKFPFPRLIIERIQVSFEDEIGEGITSWKGGVIETSHIIEKGESMLQCLRRMEKERIFR